MIGIDRDVPAGRRAPLPRGYSACVVMLLLALTGREASAGEANCSDARAMVNKYAALGAASGKNGRPISSAAARARAKLRAACAAGDRTPQACRVHIITAELMVAAMDPGGVPFTGAQRAEMNRATGQLLEMARRDTANCEASCGGGGSGGGALPGRAPQNPAIAAAPDARPLPPAVKRSAERPSEGARCRTGGYFIEVSSEIPPPAEFTRITRGLRGEQRICTRMLEWTILKALQKTCGHPAAGRSCELPPFMHPKHLVDGQWRYPAQYHRVASATAPRWRMPLRDNRVMTARDCLVSVRELIAVKRGIQVAHRADEQLCRAEAQSMRVLLRPHVCYGKHDVWFAGVVAELQRAHDVALHWSNDERIPECRAHVSKFGHDIWAAKPLGWGLYPVRTDYGTKAAARADDVRNKGSCFHELPYQQIDVFNTIDSELPKVCKHLAAYEKCRRAHAKPARKRRRRKGKKRK